MTSSVLGLLLLFLCRQLGREGLTEQAERKREICEGLRWREGGRGGGGEDVRWRAEGRGERKGGREGREEGRKGGERGREGREEGRGGREGGREGGENY